MSIPSEDEPHLKAWLTKKLPEVTDTDTETLVDYILALLNALKNRGSQEETRSEWEKELEDFLYEGAAPGFVDDVFKAIRDRAYLPGGAPAAQSAAATAPLPPATKSRQDKENSKKRSFNDAVGPESANGQQGAPGVYGRFSKALKHGDNASAAEPGTGEAHVQNHFGHGKPPSGPRSMMNNQFGYGQPPTGPSSVMAPPHGAQPFQPPGFQPNSMAASASFAGMGGQPYSTPAGPYGQDQQQRQQKPCRDFENKGYCAKGNTCNFDHGTSPMTGPAGFGPNGNGFDAEWATNMLTQNFQQFQQLMEALNAQQRDEGGARNKANRGGKSNRTRKNPKKAAFSASGPSKDCAKQTIVVENIPEEKFSEEAIIEFFSEFGKPTEVSLQRPYRNRPLAIIKFSTRDEAHAAWSSPKVIFDNRFVKVFWYRDDDWKPLPENNTVTAEAFAEKQQYRHRPVEADAEPEPEIDMDEFIKKQEEAQRRHEENTQKREDLDKQRLELEQKQRDLLQRQRDIRQKLNEKTGGADGASSSDKDGGPSFLMGNSSGGDALRAQLAALEEEAKILGLDPDADDGASMFGGGSENGFSFRGRGRGRGGWRGSRGSGSPFAPRGRGAPRGRYGRGGAHGDVHAAYAAYSLDNRPRVVAISGVDFTDTDKDEALRQHLLGVGEFTDIETTSSAANITFKDRKTAERFYYAVMAGGGNGGDGKAPQIPGIEADLEVSWVQKPLPPVKPTTTINAGDNALQMDGDAARKQGEAGDYDDVMTDRAAGARQDLDYEQASEDGEWGIE